MNDIFKKIRNFGIWEDILPFAETFQNIEDGSIPENWTTNTNLWGVYNNQLRFQYDQNSQIGEYYIITEYIDLTDDLVSPILQFQYSVDHSINDFIIKIFVSVDNGSTWETLYEQTVNDNIFLNTLNIMLQQHHLISNLKIKIAFDGDPVNINYWYINRIKIME